MRRFVDDDRNTRFFHSYVKERRKEFHLSEITTDQGVILSANKQIVEEAKRFYTEQFNRKIKNKI